MTNQQKQTYLRERINDLLGNELKKLEFGCEVKVVSPKKYEKYDDVFKGLDFHKVFIQNLDRSSRNQIYRYDVGVGNMGYHTYWQASIKSDIWDEMIADKKIEILGREPSLADVLRAIGTQMKTNLYAITTNGEFIKSEDIYRYNYTPTLVKYNLALPFSKQDEAVYDLLIDILK